MGLDMGDFTASGNPEVGVVMEEMEIPVDPADYLLFYDQQSNEADHGYQGDPLLEEGQLDNQRHLTEGSQS